MSDYDFTTKNKILRYTLSHTNCVIKQLKLNEKYGDKIYLASLRIKKELIVAALFPANAIPIPLVGRHFVIRENRLYGGIIIDDYKLVNDTYIVYGYFVGDIAWVYNKKGMLIEIRQIISRCSVCSFHTALLLNVPKYRYYENIDATQVKKISNNDKEYPELWQQALDVINSHIAT